MDVNGIILYYSWSGNTQKIAEIIQQKTRGELFELKPATPYPRNYSVCTQKAKQEIAVGSTPELKALPHHLKNYDCIFVGSPIWWHTMAPPLLSFLKSADVSGKQIIPFCTHGGGGAGGFSRDIAAQCTNAVLHDSLVLFGDGGSAAESDITAWLERLNLS